MLKRGGKGNYIGVADGAGDGAVEGHDAWVGAEAVRDELEHIGSVVEGAGHPGVELFEGGDGVGLWGGGADVSEGLEGVGVVEKVTGLGIARLECECESNMRDGRRHTLTWAPRGRAGQCCRPRTTWLSRRCCHKGWPRGGCRRRQFRPARRRRRWHLPLLAMVLVVSVVSVMVVILQNHRGSVLVRVVVVMVVVVVRQGKKENVVCVLGGN